MVILAVDLGKTRTGLAICDRMEMLASPVGTLTERDTDRLLKKVAAVVRERGVEQVVVGHPRNMDGSCGESAQHAQQFAADLEKLCEVNTVLWDERLTTVSAIGYLNQTDTRGKKRKAVVDTVSAVIILEDYLRSRH